MTRISPAFAPTGFFVALALATGGLHGVETTGSAAVSAGSMDSDSGLNFEGAYAILLGGGFGFQIDGMHSSIGTTEFAGGGAQVFWQNNSPWLASLGFASVHGEWVESQEMSAGLQFQQDWYSIGAKVGYARISYDAMVPFIDDKENSLLMEIHADFYVSETLRASLGVEHRFDLLFAEAELEWLTPVDGLSLFANCMVGQNQYDHALVGLRYYFGGETRSLKGRRQTPRPMGNGVLHAMGNHGAHYNSQGRKYLAAKQAFGFSGGSGQYGGVLRTNAGSSNYTGASGSNASFNFYGGSGVVGSGTLTLSGGTVLGPGSSPGTLLLSGNLPTLTNVTHATGSSTSGSEPTTNLTLSGSDVMGEIGEGSSPWPTFVADGSLYWMVIPD